MLLSAAFGAHYGLDSYAVRVLPGSGGIEVIVSKDGARSRAASKPVGGSWVVMVDGTAAGTIADSSEYHVAQFACAGLGLDTDPGPSVDGEGPWPPAVTGGRLVRHEWAEPYDYIGVADRGAAEGNPVWTIRRIEVALNGEVTTATAANAIWTDRATEEYA